MHKLRRRSATIALLALLMGVLTTTLTTSPAIASHFRANQLTWTKVSGTTVDFHATGSWRCTYFVDPCDLAVGDAFPEEPASLDFGDGEFSSGEWTVTQVDVTNDVVSGELETDHTYPDNGPYTATISGCCRLSMPQHINNPDGDLVVSTIVDLAGTSASPVSSISPIVDCPLEALCQFTIPAFDPDGQGLRYRLATADEAGFAFVQPGPPNSTSAASINATTGLYSWDTSGALLSTEGSTFYSTQVIVENVVGSTVVSQTAVDFFIRLGSNSTNQQPVFTSPTPLDGSVLNAYVGQPFTFSSAAFDPDSTDTVTLGILGKPAAATYATTSGNPASGTFTWTPTATGTVLLTLTAQDQQGLGAVARSVTINIGDTPPPNQAPVAADDLATTAEDTAKVTSVLANDTDADGDTLVVTSPTPTAAHGTVTCTSTQCTYTPAANYNGTDSYDYTISDGKGGTDTGTVTVTVTAVNDAPDAVADSKSTSEDSAAVVTVLTNDTDVDGDTLTVTSAAPLATHGTVSCTSTQCTYTPAPNYNGSDSFSYTISDGHGGTDTATVSVTVTAVNDGPDAVDDAASAVTGVAKPISVLANDTDVDGDALSVTGHGSAAHGTVSCSAATCTYTATGGSTGTDTFTYSISDGHGGSDTATVTVTVTSVPAVDVSVVKSALLPTVAVGNLAGWRITVTNVSSSAAGSVTVSDVLPAGFVVRSDDSASCATSGGTFTCSFGTLAAGAVRTVAVVGAFTRGGTTTNTAHVSATNDQNAGNDSDSATVAVTGQTCTIVGTFGDDILVGTNGRDVICGLAGDDRINGKQGDDVLYGNEGDDRLQGLGGNDDVDGGAGRDRSLYSALLQAVRVDLAEHVATGQGTDVLVSIEEVTGSAKADVLLGDGLANLLLGGGGNDRLSGAGGNDTLKGGRGADRLRGGAGKDRLVGGAGADRIRGGIGHDSCTGGAGADSLASC